MNLERQSGCRLACRGQALARYAGGWTGVSDQTLLHRAYVDQEARRSAPCDAGERRLPCGNTESCDDDDDDDDDDDTVPELVLDTYQEALIYLRVFFFFFFFFFFKNYAPCPQVFGNTGGRASFARVLVRPF